MVPSELPVCFVNSFPATTLQLVIVDVDNDGVFDGIRQIDPSNGKDVDKSERNPEVKKPVFRGVDAILEAF